MFILGFASILLLIFLLTYLYFNIRFTYWKRKGVLSRKPQFIFGNAKTIILQNEHIGCAFQNVYEYCKMNYQPFIGYYFFTKPILVVCDLNLVNRIMVTDFEYFTDRVFYSSKQELLSLHLGAIKGLDWKENRLAFSPIFTSVKIKLLNDSIKKCTDKFIADLKDLLSQDKSFDVETLITQLSMNVIITCLFGLDSKTMKNKDFLLSGEQFWSKSIKLSFIRLLMLVYPEILLKMKITTASQSDTSSFISTVLEVLSSMDRQHSFLRFIKIASLNCGKLFNIQNIAAQCYFILIAGYETISTLISCCLYELAINEPYQEQVRKEVVEIIAKSNGNMSYDQTTQLIFLNKCMKETLRKYPPTTVLRRECTKTYHIEGTNVTIEKGTYVFVSITGIHNDSSIYPNPEKFEPDRFSDDNAAQRHPCAWVPFGRGPRMCLGYRFALLEAQIVIANILQNFHITLSAGTETSVHLDPKAFLVKSSKGIWLNFQKITQ